jgi:hypothetical protein
MTNELGTILKLAARHAKNELGRIFEPSKTHVSTILNDGAVFKDNKRRATTKPRCNLPISTTRSNNIGDGIATEFKKQAKTDIQTCFRSDVPYVDSRPPGHDFFFDGTWFRQTGCSRLAQILSTWVPALPALQRYSERVPSVLQGLDANGGPPSIYRAINDEYNITFPENNNPDSKIIPDPWEKPKEESTKHADIPDELKAVLLDYYRAHHDSNEQIQTNFFYGDNDNAPPEDSLDYVSQLKVACDWEDRPSVEEMMKALAGVKWDTRPAFTDSRGNKRPEMVVPFEGDVIRDSDSRTVKEIEWEKAFAERTEKMSAEQKAEYAKVNSPIYTPPIRKWAKIRFCTTDFDKDTRGSNQRGELLTVESDKGVEYRGRDRARKSKIVLTQEQSDQIKESAEYRFANLCRYQRVNPDEVSMDHVKPLSEADREKQWAEKARQTKLWYAAHPKIKPDPAFFTASMTLGEARAKHNVTPSNDNRVYSGLPWTLWRPDYLVPKNDRPSPIFADTPEEFWIENHSRENIQAAKSELSADEVLVLDSFMSSMSFGVLGSKTGDDGKHERTQERNGKQRLLQVAAKYSAILAKIAA